MATSSDLDELLTAIRQSLLKIQYEEGNLFKSIREKQRLQAKIQKEREVIADLEGRLQDYSIQAGIITEDEAIDAVSNGLEALLDLVQRRRIPLEESGNVTYLAAQYSRNGDLKAAIMEALETLPRSEAVLLTMYFGINTDAMQSPDAIRQRLGMKGKHIEVRISRALGRLRHPSRYEKLREFISQKKWEKLCQDQTLTSEVELLCAIFGQKKNKSNK